MVDTTLNLVVSLDAGRKVPEQRLYDLTTQVLRDIARSGVDSVERAKGGKAVAGAMGLPPIDVNTLLITLASAGAVTTVLQLLRDWVLRGEGRKVTVKVKTDDKSIEFEYMPTAASEAELMNFAEELIHMLDKSSLYRGK